MFHQFDFGTDQNILKYGSAKPPDYNLSRVTAPVAIWYGLNDRLVYHEVSGKPSLPLSFFLLILYKLLIFETFPLAGCCGAIKKVAQFSCLKFG